MSTLLVEEFKTSLVQGFTLENYKRYVVEAIYPHLYSHDDPTGTFTFTLAKNAVTIFTKTFTAASIRSSLDVVTSDRYIHTYYPIIPSTDILIDGGDYTFTLTHSGYTFAEGNYLGWCRNFEESDYKSDVGQFNDSTNPMQLRLVINEVP